MENIERTLEAFTWNKPPEWLKDHALFAAQAETMRHRSRRRLQTALVAAIAAGLVLAAVGHFVANLIAPFRDNRPVPVQAGTISPLPGAVELIRDGGRPLRSVRPVQPAHETVDEGALAPVETGSGGE